MKPNDIKTGKGAFRTHKTVSVEEIFAAGGATAFGVKSGKSNETIIKALENAPKPEPFTEEEWNDLLYQLANDK